MGSDGLKNKRTKLVASIKNSRLKRLNVEEGKVN